MRCAAHGLIEATTETPGWPGSDATGFTVEHICPVSVGDGDTCGLTLDSAEPVVSLSDLQREIAVLYANAWQPLAPHTTAGYERALTDLASRLGIDLEEGKD